MGCKCISIEKVKVEGRGGRGGGLGVGGGAIGDVMAEDRGKRVTCANYIIKHNALNIYCFAKMYNVCKR